jgi:hypothetical protein
MRHCPVSKRIISPATVWKTSYVCNIHARGMIAVFKNRICSDICIYAPPAVLRSSLLIPLCCNPDTNMQKPEVGMARRQIRSCRASAFAAAQLPKDNLGVEGLLLHCVQSWICGSSKKDFRKADG